MRLSDQRHTVRLPLPDLIVRGRAHTLYAPIYLDGALVEPVSGSVTVINANNASVVTGSVTIGDGIPRYTIGQSALTSEQLGEGWRVEWVLTLASGDVLHPRNDAALVRSGLWPVITDHDLTRRIPGLSQSGRAPVTRSVSYQDAIDEAWVEIQLRLIGRGNRPNLILEPSALRNAHLYLAIALVLEDQEMRSAPVFEAKAAQYRALYEQAWSELQPRYDTNDDGQADTRRRSASPTVWLSGGDRRETY